MAAHDTSKDREAMTRRRWAIVFVVTLAACPWAARAASDTYQIDPAGSHVTIAVGKSGAFSFVAGHTHEVSGPFEGGTAEVDLDEPARSKIHLTIATTALKVSGAKEPPADRPQVQQTMESDKVLDIARYPTISFDSTNVKITRRDTASLEAVVDGQLTLHGVTRPVSVPVRVELTGAALTAQGRLPIKQTDFGIKPVSVAGVVSVKDTLDVSFSIAARR
jgi:polyisoprenoid-binding protein YceI